MVFHLRGDSNNWLPTLLHSRPRLSADAAAHSNWTSEHLAGHLLTVLEPSDDKLQLCGSTRDTSDSWPVTERQAAAKRYTEYKVMVSTPGSKQAEVLEAQGAKPKLRDSIALFDACIKARDCVVALEHLPPAMALYDVLTGDSSTCGLAGNTPPPYKLLCTYVCPICYTVDVIIHAQHICSSMELHERLPPGHLTCFGVNLWSLNR